MERLLFITDGNRSAESARNWAMKKCVEDGICLDILYIIDSSLEHYGEVDILATDADKKNFIEYSREQEWQAGRCYTENWKEKTSALGIEGQVYLQQGEASSVVEEFFNNRDPRFVVIGDKKSFWTKKSPLKKAITRVSSCRVKWIT